MMCKNSRQILCLIMALALLFSACSMSDFSDKQASKVGEITKDAPLQTEGAGNSAETGADPSNQGQQTQEAATTAAPEKAFYEVGDAVEIKDLKIIYTASGEYISESRYDQPKEGYSFIFLEFYVEYSGSGNTSVSYLNFDGYADGYAVDQKYSFDDELGGRISKGRWNIGKVYFEVPKDAKEIEVEYEYDAWSNKKIKFAYEGNRDSGFVPEPKTTPTEGAFKPGDIIETKRFRISYLNCGVFTSENMFYQPDKGNVFIYLEFEFENISDSDYSVNGWDFNCFANGKTCEQRSAREDELGASLSPGRKAKGTVAFEVPENAETIEIEYEENLFSTKLVIFSFTK